MTMFKTNNSKCLTYGILINRSIFFLKLNKRYIDAGRPGVALGADILVSRKRNMNTGQNAFLQNNACQANLYYMEFGWSHQQKLPMCMLISNMWLKNWWRRRVNNRSPSAFLKICDVIDAGAYVTLDYLLNDTVKSTLENERNQMRASKKEVSKNAWLTTVRTGRKA